MNKIFYSLDDCLQYIMNEGYLSVGDSIHIVGNDDTDTVERVIIKSGNGAAEIAEYTILKPLSAMTDENLRKFMRQCQQFWSRQWYIDHEGTPHQWSYTQSLIGVWADMRTVIDKPNVHFATPGDVITEAHAEHFFNTEFSEPWQDIKNRFAAGTIIGFKTIPNGDAIYRDKGRDGIMEAANSMNK